MKRSRSKLFPISFRPTLIALLLSGSAGFAGAQTTYIVDDDAPGDPGPQNPFVSDPLESGTAANPFDRIQEAIDAAADGDEVLIRDGVYFDFGTIDLSSGMGSGKSLWIHSEDGPEVTIVDATGLSDQVMQAVSGEDSNTILEGLTLRGGSAIAANPNDRGAGLNLNASSPTVIDCTFDSNVASAGAGVFSNGGTPVLVGCRFVNNMALNDGGGIYVTTGSPTVDGCSFEGNAAVNEGGGMFANALFTVRDSVFFNNVAGTSGGGIYQFTSSPTLTVERTLFASNTAFSWGGGIHCTQTVWVRDSVFNANECTGANAGGGIGVTASGQLIVDGSTFVDNDGYAVRVSTGSATIRNSILWSNGPAELLGSIGVSYSDVLGGWAGTGNTNVDPLFRDADGRDGVVGTLDDDLRLFHMSPCIDAGNTTVVSALAPSTQYPQDIKGDPRAVDRPDTSDSGVAVLGMTVDMGAYEFPLPPCAHRVQTP